VPNAPELLAPAGDWDALRAAVANGADAVYFGLPQFNARHRATNFGPDELPAVMDYLHRHNVKGFVTFNTLIFSNELPEAVRYAETIVGAGADAVIVQDLGLAALLHRLAPQLPLHASTQMTLTEPRGIEFARRLGVERVVLARELSLEEIRKVTAGTPMPVEVFAHGALCVAYSGQCLTSEALGGRSANRGQCAQACRLPYELVADGQVRDLGGRAYLLSPQDLAAYEQVKPLAEAGVVCLKIEGRLKSAAYVANTVQTYRRAIDAAAAGGGFTLSRRERLDLEQSFSRGLTPGFLEGVNHQRLVEGRNSKSRGVRVGTVVGVGRRGVRVELASAEAELAKPGDGVVFDEGHPEREEQGGRVFEVVAGLPPTPALPRQGGGRKTARPDFPPSPLAGEGRGGGDSARLVELRFAHDALDPRKIPVGAVVWKTDDPALRKRLEQSFAADRVARRVPLSVRVAGRAGGALTVTVRDPNGRAAAASWPGPLEVARKHPATADSLREPFARLGDTPFELAELTADLPDAVMVPRSVVNDLRRQAVAQLLERRAVPYPRKLTDPGALDRWREAIVRRERVPVPDSPQLHVLARTPEQLDAALAWRPATVYCDFEDPRRYREAVARAKAAGVPVGLAPLRIVKPGEDGFLRQVAGAGADVLLVRNLASLALFRELAPETALVGDFALNVANELTADLLADEGLTRMVPSYDLNWEQLSALVRNSDPGRVELVIHQHMPMFHTEWCVFAAYLSNGTNHTNCGRPCDRHTIELRDRAGASFPVHPDAGCRNTVYNAHAQSAAEYVGRMLALGLRHFRVELLREKPEQVRQLLDCYARVLAGLDDGRGTWRQLRALNQLGVTRGTLQLL
jgi:putative protease